MYINKFIFAYKELPKPIKRSTLIYLLCLFGYNIFGSYRDSKFYLDKFREGSLKETKIKSDWDAVKYGASVNFGQRMFDSLVWPITTINNTIPALVLALNPPKKS